MRLCFLITTVTISWCSLAPSALDLFAHRLEIHRDAFRMHMMETGSKSNVHELIEKYNKWIDSTVDDHQDQYHVIVYRYLCGIFYDIVSDKCLPIDSGKRERAILLLQTLLKKVRSGPRAEQCLSPEAPVFRARFQEELEGCQRKSDPAEPCAVAGQSFLINGIETFIQEELAHGTQGRIYMTSNPRIIVKEQFKPDCKEIAAMKVLDGLGGFAPKLLEISEKDDCKIDHLLAMEKLGDSDWETIMIDHAKDVPPHHAFLRFSKLLSAIKSLHYLGFSHNDVHAKNIRIYRDDPSVVFLIDFGFLFPFDQQSPAADLGSFFGLLFGFFRKTLSAIQISSFVWMLDALYAETSDALQCPHYDKWIWVFGKLADPDDVSEQQIKEAVCANLPAAYEEWKQARIANSLRTGDGQSVQLIHFPRSFSLPNPEPFTNPSPPRNMYIKVAQMIMNQADSDHAYPETAPYLYHDGEIIKETNGVSGIVSSRILHCAIQNEQIKDAVVAKSDDDLIIVFRSNCDDLADPLFSMQREFGFMKLLSNIGVWLSPPVKLPIVRSSKVNFDISSEQYMECAEDPRSQVRFMVTKRISSVRWIHFPSLGSVLEMTISLITQLKEIHDQKIILGSITPDSIIQSHSVIDGSVQFGFSNFKRTFFEAELDPAVCDGTVCATVPTTDTTSSPCTKTHWEIDGYRPSYRDDVFNVLLVAAKILDPLQRMNFCSPQNVPDDLEQVRTWKSQAFIFESNFVSEAPPTVRAHLESALRIARSVDSVNTIPDHMAIIHELSQAFHIDNQ